VGEISSTGDQMLTVLEHVAASGPISVKDVATGCDLNRTVTHRLLNTLAVRGYVRKSDKGFVVGPAVLTLIRSVDVDLRATAKPTMNALSKICGETVVLHAIDRLEAVVIDQAIGTAHVVRVEHKPGSRHPLDKGASGWAMLAFQDDRWIDRFAKKFGNENELRTRIADTRKSGYSISFDELQLGVHGLAVPIVETTGICQASLAILVPPARAERLIDWRDPLKEAAAEIAANLAKSRYGDD
jgi:DNA-binding IclR family transcriptional regulator